MSAHSAGHVQECAASAHDIGICSVECMLYSRARVRVMSAQGTGTLSGSGAREAT